MKVNTMTSYTVLVSHHGMSDLKSEQFMVEKEAKELAQGFKKLYPKADVYISSYRIEQKYTEGIEEVPNG